MLKTILRQSCPVRLEDSFRLLLLSTTSFRWVPVRNFRLEFTLNAGHSKWQNIRHTKHAKDLERSKLVAKLSQRMQVAIKEFGSVDPVKNDKLAQVIHLAKVSQIPVGTINKLLDKISTDKVPKHSDTLAIRGPGRSTFIVEIFAESRKRAKSELAAILNKHGGVYVELGSALHHFTVVGRVECSHLNDKPVTEGMLEDAVTHAIEASAEDVQLEDHIELKKILVFRVPTDTFLQVKGALKKVGYSFCGAEITYDASILSSLSEEEMVKASNLIDKLHESPHVVKIYDNVGGD